jgi:hypothetical protein
MRNYGTANVEPTQSTHPIGGDETPLPNACTIAERIEFDHGSQRSPKTRMTTFVGQQ